tara:strand:- start:42415 stop:44568 length:2154 start_codon:yes stop_codon:yes gene_type:complete
MPVVIKSRLAWEALFVQPIAQQMDMGQVKGTLHLCQLISQHYDSVIKTGACNFPPTGPTPPAPMTTGKTPLFQTSFFVGLKASEVLNLVTTPPLVLAEKALAKAMKKNKDKIDKLNEKREKLEPLIKKSKQIADKLKGIKDVYDKSKALDYRGAIDAGAKEFESPLIPGFDKLKEKADDLTEPEIKKEINKKIEKEKQKQLKKLEPLKLKIQKKLDEIEKKIKDLINRVTQKITKKIAEAQMKKAKLAADTAKAASMSYVQTVEANIALAKQKIAAAKEMVKKIKIMVANGIKIVAWVKGLKLFINKLKEFSKNIPALKDLLKPPSPPPPPNLPGGNILGFGKMNLDIRSKEFELPELPDPPDVTSLVEELKEKGVDAVKNNPDLKRKTAKLEAKIDKTKKKIEAKLEKIQAKIDELKKKIEDKIKEIKKKAIAAGKKLLKKMIPPGDKDPTAKAKIIKEKQKKIKELLAKIKKLKEQVEEEVVKRIEQIKKLIARGKAIMAIIDLVKQGGVKNYMTAIDEGAKPFESPTIPGFDKLKEEKDTFTNEEQLKKAIMKRVDKIKEKNQKKLEKYEKKLEKAKARIEEKMKPIEERLERYKSFVTKIAKPPVPAEVTPSGKLIASALSVGLITYWTAGQVALPGGMITFPGLPLQSLKTLDGEPAVEAVAKVFNKDSEMDNADKMRTLANVFDVHAKTVTGTWMMPTPGGPVLTPWISYG